MKYFSNIIYCFEIKSAAEMFMCFMLFLAICLTLLVSWWYCRYFYFYSYMKYFPQVEQFPLVGGALEFSSTSALYKRLLELRKELGNSFWTMLVQEPVLFAADPELAKTLLTSQENMEKSRLYTFLHKWLGFGLLTSSGDKWRIRRKLITPAFSFKKLEEFGEILNRCGDALMEKLSLELDKTSIDIYEYVGLCTLDGLCETAMGIHTKVQMDAHSEYVNSVRAISRIPFERQFRIFENFTLTYCFTKNYWKERTLLKYLHNFTDSVIRRRQKEFKNTNEVVDCENKKLAFLDLLLNYSANDSEFRARDIREEVDTFMMAGHDTTASGISFALFLLANHADIQRKAFAEIRSIVSDDETRAITFKDCQEMKYLEMVIKESLRLYPSAPLFGRKLSKDMETGGRTLPKGLTILMLPFVMNRDPNLFPEPDVFNPDRFLASEISKAHPFCFIPFSAGPRNCIGQKYAMLSMKLIISKVLKNFELLPVEHNFELVIEMTLKSRNGIPMKLIKRR